MCCQPSRIYSLPERIYDLSERLKKRLTQPKKGIYCTLQTGRVSGLHLNVHTLEETIMGRRRRNSPVLERATTRATNLKAISPTLDLGPGLTLVEFQQKITEFTAAQDEYNVQIAALDEKQNTLKAKEKALHELNTRMLAAVGARWGKNSSQYEQAGGTRTEERKKPTRGKDKNATKKPTGS
jgi:hypothetical protein